VLPIGGVRDKLLAAQRAGLRTVVLPQENEPDLEQLPAEAQGELELVLADSMAQVLESAFEGAALAARPVVAQERQAASPAR
jgi:ATP-dependent Lon protease